MNANRWRLAVGLVAALVLAFFLRDFVQILVIDPLAYLFWALGVVYRIIPQQVYWIFLIIGLFYVALNSFYAKRRSMDEAPPPAPSKGSVETMAYWVERGQGGVYFRWQVARILAQTALSIAELRENRRLRAFEWPDDEPSTQVKRYLDAGLNSSFADYPLESGISLFQLGRKQPSTPFDIDVEKVIAYLESEMENRHDH
jgi:hypothetical protein